MLRVVCYAPDVVTRRTFVALGACLASSCLADIPELQGEGTGVVTTGAASGSSTGSGTSGFCVGHAGALVCEDFDAAQSTPPDWSEHLTTAASHLEIDGSSSASPPNSLRAWVDADGTGGGSTCAYAQLRRELDGDPGDVALQLRAASTVEGVVATLSWRRQSATCFVLLSNQPDRLELLVQHVPDGGSATSGSVTFQPLSGALGEYRLLAAELVRSGGAPIFTSGGSPPSSADDLGFWQPCLGPADEGTFRLELGAHCVGSGDPVTDSRIDDVLLTEL